MQCTFHGNSAPFGSNISGDCGGDITIDRCIVTGGQGSMGVYAENPGAIVLNCTDIFGNDGGDWVGPIVMQQFQDGNIHADPLYCDPAAHDFTLAEDSPCAPEPNPECGRMGAHGIGCQAPVAVPPAGLDWLRLEPNHPNPFNPATTIPFWVREECDARLGIFTVQGRLVTWLLEGPIAAGFHSVVWRGLDANGRPVPAATYLYRLETNAGVVSRTLVLLK